jgi:C1A family cysteine protease
MKLITAIRAFFAALFAKTPDPTEHSLASWIPDTTDPRDRVYEQTFGMGRVRREIDLRAMIGPVENQGAPNSCVGHAVTAVLEAVLKISDRSRLFVYWNARVLEGRSGVDAGCQIRNAMRAVSTQGAAVETLWPHDTTKITTAPPVAAFADGKPVAALIGQYLRVTTFAGLKSALVAGRPVAFGFSVPDTWNAARTSGHLPFPAAGVRYIGAHAVVAVGYDDVTGNVLCRNSFGAGWGSGGHFTMPYAWFDNMSGLVSDAWTVVAK